MQPTDHVIRHILKHVDLAAHEFFEVRGFLQLPPVLSPPQVLSAQPFISRGGEQGNVVSFDVWDNKRLLNRSKPASDPLHEQNFRLRHGTVKHEAHLIHLLLRQAVEQVNGRLEVTV